MKTTIGDVVSRIKGQLKAVKQDAFLTDRFIYSLVRKHAALLVSREDSQNKMLRVSSMIRTLHSVPLVEVDRIEAGCLMLQTGITVMRTKDPINVFLQGYYGPLISDITSLDGTQSMQQTTPSQYMSLAGSKNFRYNKTLYYWYVNNHLYFPNIVWPAVRIQGIPEDDISGYECPDCGTNTCRPRQEQEFNLPEKLLSPIENMVKEDVYKMFSIPPDTAHDNQNLLK